jgi:hypothetical protein
MTSTPQKALKKIIRRMVKIQKAISEDNQPVSQLQLEELVQLGKQYADTVEDLKKG